MQLEFYNLPSDTALLHRLVRDIATVIAHRNSEIQRLQAIIKQLQRGQFGRRSERLDADQLALGLEDLDIDLSAVEADQALVEASAPTQKLQPKRKPLPDHLPRENVVLNVDGERCASSGGALHAIGESVSEMPDWVPAQSRLCASAARNMPAVAAE
jgi:hypothetical protein